MGLKNLGIERLNIYPFGSKTPKKQTCRKVEVRLRNVLSGEETVIEAVEIEEISRATLSLPNHDAWREMESRGFRLTFSCSESSESCEISLLIGSDFFWSLTNRIKRLDSSLVAVETSLGWSLQGKCDERSNCTSVHLIHSEEESISAELRSQGFYLPHHAVIRSDKTTSRLRIVFDGSAHEDGHSSLNQSLYTGPNLHPNIFELLLLFRVSTLTRLRKKYWIPKGRQLVKTMIRICLICKKYNAKPADQLSGQLHRDRISQSPPFQIVGIDFTGSILVKENKETRKSYVALFTCAVHLELVSDMSTKCLLVILCCFVYMCRTFRTCIGHVHKVSFTYFTEVPLSKRQLQDNGIHWTFIVERAPWWGGFYERLVKTVKEPLHKILGKALLTFEELSSILSEIEVIVNNRPLTYVENDPGEPEPLTPAHFLELGYGDSKYPAHFIELIDSTTARASYKKRKTYQTLLLKQL
ncbi:hypothetical protein AVEN_74810-1 [Araneus ventricosus]|uniref:Integrase catalytic domain-containing protein n=1 Tax=Araneus ventricosus TaxID=182803 RepID=A0A4Y2HNW5_ARAVE|nr:hypothetical protein AVEN_74810-1 [Araneus ventricosus]